MLWGLNACSDDRDFPTNNAPSDAELTPDELTNHFADPITADFYYGADPSYITMEEDKGCKFYNTDGQAGDCFDILKNVGFNAARFRVWVEPKDNYCYIDDVIEKAERAAMVGQRIMIDFHYSDDWADPTKQYIPASFEGAQSIDELASMAANYTKESLQKIKAKGIDVTWVQIGNESHRGIMCDGTSLVEQNNYEHYTKLHNACAKAAKEVYPNVKTVVHFANGQRADYINKAISFVKAGAEFDIFGVSVYPNYADKSWYATYVEGTVANLNKFVAETGKDVMLCEVGSGSFDYKGSDGWTIPDQIAKPQATAFLNDMSFFARTEIQNCKGIFFWEPQCYNKGGENYHLGGFTQEGKPGEGLLLMCSNPAKAIYDPAVHDVVTYPEKLVVCGIVDWKTTFKMTKKGEGLFEIDLTYEKAKCPDGFGVFEFDLEAASGFDEIWKSPRYYSPDNNTLQPVNGDKDNIKFAADDKDGIYTLVVNLKDMTMSLTFVRELSDDEASDPEEITSAAVGGLNGDWSYIDMEATSEKGVFSLEIEIRTIDGASGFGFNCNGKWNGTIGDANKELIATGLYKLTLNANDNTWNLELIEERSYGVDLPTEVCIKGGYDDWTDVTILTETSTKGIFECELTTANDCDKICVYYGTTGANSEWKSNYDASILAGKYKVKIDCTSGSPVVTLTPIAAGDVESDEVQYVIKDAWSTFYKTTKKADGKYYFSLTKQYENFKIIIDGGWYGTSDNVSLVIGNDGNCWTTEANQTIVVDKETMTITFQ